MNVTDSPSISIITPSLNMLSYLKRCHASVVDQEGSQVEHIVKDGGSTDGTVEWLNKQPDLLYKVCKDESMYDAINQGLNLAHGELIGYLNCDEQYLPGTLKYVIGYFAEHADVDILFGDALVVDPEGGLLAYRKGYQPRWYYIASSHLYVLSCTMFFRRRLIEEGLGFDNGYTSIGDQEFVIRALRRRYKAAHVSRYLSVFTVTGDNLSAKDISRSESKQLSASMPQWLVWAHIPLNLMRLSEKVLSGAYHQEMPLVYKMYTQDLNHRKRFEARRSTFKWPEI